MCQHMMLRKHFSSVSIETPHLENYFHLSICMLFRAMCSQMVLLTQFDPLCAFETSNLEKYFHLSIFMLRRAMCSRIVLLTQCYPHCA